MILLSFDTEEFDVPRESGLNYNTLKEGMEVSTYGTYRILDILKRNNVCATFFCTSNFATHAPQVMHRILNEGHEVAAHGCDHWHPQTSDVFKSKSALQELYGITVMGYRQPRMFPVNEADIHKAGYKYNSSLNPTFIPGKYNHLSAPRRPFTKNGVLQIPASVTPWLRIPLFWLSCHNFPFWLYKILCLRTLRHDGHIATYFHPWEFYPLAEHIELRIPYIVRRNSGMAMEKRLEQLIKTFKKGGHRFITFSEFAQS